MAVSIVNKYSTALSAAHSDADLPSPPHIIVTETADAGLLGEFMLPTLLHAAKTLASPSASHPSRTTTLIPGSAVVYAALIDDASLLRMSRATFFSAQLRSDEAYSCGKLPTSASVLTSSFVGENSFLKFDLSPFFFHKLQPWRYCSVKTLLASGIRFSSVSAHRAPPHTKQTDVECHRSGSACCILLWWTMHLAPGISLTYAEFSRSLAFWWRNAVSLFKFAG
jgi:hypothetical protein